MAQPSKLLSFCSQWMRSAYSHYFAAAFFFCKPEDYQSSPFFSPVIQSLLPDYEFYMYQHSDFSLFR